MIKEYKTKTRSQQKAKRLELKAFTLLELLLVIAIIAVLAGLVIFNLRPADVLQNANDTKNVANSKDIKKALEAYALDHDGNLPTSLQGQTSGEYTICKQSEVSCPVGSISLDELITGGYLSTIPVNTDLEEEKTTGYAIEYDADKLTFNIIPNAEVVAADIETGLVGWWEMDESVANACAGGVNDSCDASGNGSDGAWNGNVTTSEGKFGNGTVYDGINGYLTTPVPAVTNFTISLWIKVLSNQVGERQIFSGPAGDVGISLYTDKKFLFWDGSFFTSTTVANVGTWYHITITSDGITKRLYVNGIMENSGSYTRSWNAGTARWARDAIATRYLNAIFDEIRVYNRTLSDAEVLALYNYAPGPVAHWKFDEGSGTSASDSSVYNNIGTLTNSPSWVQGKSDNGLNFPGGNGPSAAHVAVANSTSLDINSAFSLSAWVYPTAYPSGCGTAPRGAIISKGGVDTGIGYEFMWNGKSGDGYPLEFWSRSGAYHQLANPFTTFNQWYHIAGVQSDTVSKIYINGALASTVASGGNPDASSSGYTLNIGRREPVNNYDCGFTGNIDEVKIYNYARTSAQILEDMNNL
ncbi:prepilin-type N-terminal cleavage/methylation domain-containing protein [Candidatus Dojkabacteria bacterium]|nr:prepilin-type N-terminal cleavage/methylation domain-containing protein [Candidatus Dojkabacteria bacterium]